MGLFKNNFFSAAGQKERLKNVGDTLLSAVGLKKGGVQSNTGSKKLDAALSAAASHPFITAGVVAGGLAATGTKAPTAFKAVAQPAARAVGSAAAKSPGKAAIVGVVGLTTLKSEKGRTALANAPQSVDTFSTNAAALIDEPSLSNLQKLAKDDPLLTAAAGAVGLGAVGAAGRGVVSAIITAQNTQAIKESTKNAISPGPNPLTPQSVAGGSSALVAPAVDSSKKAPIIPGAAGARASNSRRKRKKKPVEPLKVSTNVKVYNIDDRDQNDRKVYK